MKPHHGHLPYSLTIACSSTLLFLVQPIIAKAILPRFGGSAGVWVACMIGLRSPDLGSLPDQ